MKKKVVLFLYFIFLFILFIPNVFARELVVKNIRVKDKSGTITVENLAYENNQITSNITFNQVNDFVTFDLLIENNTKTPFSIQSITSNHSDYLSFIFNPENTVQNMSNGHFTITIKYDKELTNREQIHYDDLKMTIHFTNEQKIINPPTKNSTIFVLILLGILGAFLFTRKKQFKLGKLFVVLLLVPFMVNAADVLNVSIDFTDITVIGRFLGYDVIVDHGDGTRETRVRQYGETVGELTAPSVTGYNFIRWIDSSTNEEVTSNTVISDNMRITPVLEPIVYHITYELDNGTLSTSNPSTYTVETATFTLNNPTKTGYTFTGWTLSGSSSLQAEVTIYKGSTGDRTYTAHYSLDGGVYYRVVHEQEQLDGESYKTYETQVFKGAVGSEVTPQPKNYAGFSIPEEQTKTIQEDGSTTFTYQYDRCQYTFSIDDRTYVTGTEGGTYYYGTEVTLTAQERPGYDFSWSDGNTDYSRTFKLQDNTELSADYVARTDTPYKVIHKKQNLSGSGYTVADTDNFTGTTDTEVTPEVNEYEGFTAPSTQTVNINGDGTTEVIYEYTRNQYTLLLTDADLITTTTPSGTYYYGKSITLTAKAKAGYTFVKWSDETTTSTYTFTLTGDTTIGPIYERDTVTITYNANGGEVNPTSKTIYVDDPIGELPTPEREDYYFVGWFTALTGGTQVSTSTTFSSTTSIYAKWMESPSLYNVLKFEYEDGGLAHIYEGEHRDSYTEEPSKNIYHWYANNSQAVNPIKEKNNVIFANHCWQMIRTTDTGGVKLLYYGEPEDNHCYTVRKNHAGYNSHTSITLSSNYWYGTDYILDYETNKFTLSGTTVQTTWNDSNYSDLIGKFTCRSTDENGTCSTLYVVEDYYNSTSAYAFSINSSSYYSQFGSLSFHSKQNSPTYAGYMYGDVYAYSTLVGVTSTAFTTTNTLFSSTSFSSSYKYSKTLNDTGSTYQLDSSISGSNIPESSYVGYYTFRSSSTTSGTQPYYIVAANGSNYYYVRLEYPKPISNYDVIVSDSITDNGDDTYTLSGTTTTVHPVDWYTDYANYVNKYTCPNGATTCANPRYITATTSTSYTYLVASEKILIGKTRSGITLGNTLLVRKDQWYSNYSSYSDYLYTCGTDSATCTESNLSIIKSYTSTGYSSASNHYYGSSVTWDGTNYTLVDPIGLENYSNADNFSTHHYMCTTVGTTTCSTVAYVYYFSNYTGKYYYITLQNGVTSVNQALSDMLTKNTHNSDTKSAVDLWYQHNLLEDYDEYIEDTVFCDDRSIADIAGWNPDGGRINSSELGFYDSHSSNNDLSCPNESDRFSVSNPNARLTYKVALLNPVEANLFGFGCVECDGRNYWLLGPDHFSYDGYIGVQYVYEYSESYNFGITNSRGVRPVISLIPGIEFSDGDGSKEHPYYVGNVYHITVESSIFNNIKSTAMPGNTVSIENYDYVATSFKLNGTLVEGKSFVMPREDVTITDIEYVPAHYIITNNSGDPYVNVPSTGKYTSKIVLDSEEYTVTSFKVNGELITGNSFVMPAENVVITDIEKIWQVTVESTHYPHPFGTVSRLPIYEHTFNGATSLTVEITYQLKSGDYVIINAPDSNTFFKNFENSASLKTETYTISGNYIKFSMTINNGHNEYYGFKAVITPSNS